MSDGWIKLHRKLCDHWLWEHKPFAKAQAFIDLLLIANFKDKKFLLGDEIINAECGTVVTSTVKLSERWGWSRIKVISFLKMLQSEEMITINSDNKKTVINIVNFEIYQDFQNNTEQQKISPKSAEKHQKSTNKNVKNVKNEKNTTPPTPSKGADGAKKQTEKPKPEKVKFAEFVSMTNDEYTSLVAKVGEEGAKRCVEILDNYKGSTGKKYVSDYRAMLNCVLARYEEEKTKKVNGGIHNGQIERNGDFKTSAGDNQKPKYGTMF